VKVPGIKGFRDVLPEEAALRRRLIERSRGVLESYGFAEIEIPLMERGELFARSVGSTSDIVEKEMYAFEDRDGALIALRPEGTASVVRAYLEAGLSRAMPIARLYYLGPMFRRERPQKGRFRQFTQIGAEFLGRDDPEADAETLCLVADICEAVELPGYRIEVNSLGDSECRPAYRKALVEFGRAKFDELCDDCKARLERNPLRLLDCKNEQCAEVTADAPMMIDHLCAPCKTHHGRVLELASGLGVELEHNPRMVRGLDYYCRTAFEVSAEGLGAQGAVGGGGRYDGLVAELGGPEQAGIGFAFGVERMQLASTDDEPAPGLDILVAPLAEEAAGVALSLARRLRRADWKVEVGASDKKLKAQLKRADKIGVRYAVLLGPDEVAAGRATVRNLAARSDHAGCFALDATAEEIGRELEGTNQGEA
jgi:histidyl-tRNA synthetase